MTAAEGRMDIIQLLVREHNRLRNELNKIGADLFGGDLKQKIEEFRRQYQKLEKIETRVLLPKVDHVAQGSAAMASLLSYEYVHSDLWVLLEEFKSVAGAGSLLSVQNAYHNFFAMADSHFKYEEIWLFPMLREVLSRQVLIDLRKEAEDIMSRAAAFAGNRVNS